MDYGKYIDHTVLKAETTRETVARFCEEARRFGFAAVCVSPCWVPFAKDRLAGSGVKVATVIGFPLGASTSATKAFEARDARAAGADELDMVVNIGALKDGRDEVVERDIRGVVEAAAGAPVKVIIETSALTDEEKVRACTLARRAGAAFVKTSTGFGKGGATAEDVRLMKAAVGEGVQVKASTGVKTREDADRLIAAGATRLGTSSGPAIVEGAAGVGAY
ncbi:MAG TPA: deoxyribose-phosphate aldolase [Anaeromyxobacteraceae bacterium]|nr:deoxyribose-phosphate aldolase [Anaeromyxobacteraceae bacterium]